MESRQRHQLITARFHRGFTIVEVLVVMAILGVILAIGMNGYVQQQQRATITKETDRVVSLLREAQSRSLSAENGSAWQVSCNGATVTLSTVTANPAVTTLQTLSKVTCQSSPVQFRKLTGQAVSNGIVTLRMNGQGVKRILVNVTGTIRTETL